MGTFDRLAGSVVSVRARAVAFDLTTYRAAVAPQLPRYLRLVESLRSARGEHISLLRGELVVRHRGFPCLGGWEKPQVSQRTSLRRTRVALTI
jgi:hypothetical protein